MATRTDLQRPVSFSFVLETAAADPATARDHFAAKLAEGTLGDAAPLVG